MLTAQRTASLRSAPPIDRGQGARTAGDLDVRLGARIRWLRMTKRMSQERLAEEIGVTTQMVQKYESGRNRLAVGRLLDIARSLGTTAADMLSALDPEART